MINAHCPARHYPEHYPILSLSKVMDIFSPHLVLSFSLFFFFSYHMVSVSTCFCKWLWERTAAASCNHGHPFSYAFPIVTCFRVLCLFKREMCKDEEFQRWHQLLCYTPFHLAGVSYSKLLFVAFSIKMSYTIFHKVS